MPTVPTTGNGELHQGAFVYSCSSAADSQCGATALPSGIALGADFDLRFDPTAPATTSLEPSASFFSADATGRLHAERAGYGVVLVMNSEGSVVDFVNLRVKTIASLGIAGVDATTAIAVGEDRTLTASPFDAAGAPLAGSLSLEWESADPKVATVTMGGELHAVAAGATVIRVVSGTSTSTVSIRVGGS